MISSELGRRQKNFFGEYGQGPQNNPTPYMFNYNYQNYSHDLDYVGPYGKKGKDGQRNWKCHHCQSNDNKHPRRFFLSIKPWVNSNRGCTIYKSYTHYKNAFQVTINYHSYNDFTTIFSCFALFQSYMYDTYGISKIRLEMNNKIGDNREHLHMWFVVKDTDVNTFNWVKNSPENGEIRPDLEVDSKPWKGDIVESFSGWGDLLTKSQEYYRQNKESYIFWDFETESKLISTPKIK